MAIIFMWSQALTSPLSCDIPSPSLRPVHCNRHSHLISVIMISHGYIKYQISNGLSYSHDIHTYIIYKSRQHAYRRYVYTWMNDTNIIQILASIDKRNIQLLWWDAPFHAMLLRIECLNLDDRPYYLGLTYIRTGLADIVQLACDLGGRMLLSIFT